MKEQEDLTRMSAACWTKLFERWSDIPASGEKKMVSYLLGQAIEKEANTKDSQAKRRGLFKWGFFHTDGCFDAYLSLLGINPQFARRAITKAREYEAAH
jgi:hypothetical protein